MLGLGLELELGLGLFGDGWGWVGVGIGVVQKLKNQYNKHQKKILWTFFSDVYYFFLLGFISGIIGPLIN